jgi:hypothetical protein
MGSSGAEGGRTEADIATIASFMALTSCLNDEEWKSADSILELGPRDQAGTDCLLAELGGPIGYAEALVKLDESGNRRALEDATLKCGMTSSAGSEDMQSGASSSDTGTDGGLADSEPSAGGLHRVDISDPEAFLAELSSSEHSCIIDNDIGQEGLAQITGASPDTTAEAIAPIIACLEDETVLRLFLTFLVRPITAFSPETSACISEGFAPLDLRQLLVPPAAGDTPVNSLALGMAALSVSVVCMNGDEWETYAPKLGMQPEDREAAACLFEELGGSAKLVEAMQKASLGEAPEELTEAFETCGLEGIPPNSSGDDDWERGK